MLKFHLLSILLGFIFFQNLNAQSITQEGNEWQLGQYSFMGGFSTSTYKIEGDSVINDMIYKKVKQLSFDGLSFNTRYLIREDSTKKVFNWNTSSEVEMMIYDFGAEVGDTITSFYDSTFNAMIVEIDSVMLLDGSFRKRQKLVSTYCNNGSEEYWIEGIGGMRLAFFDVDNLCAVDLGSLLNCFHQNGELLYGPIQSNMCEVPLSVNDLLEVDIEVSPNPANHQLNLYFSTNDFSNDEKFCLIDRNGKVVQEIRILQNEKNYSIPVEQFPQGIYFLQYFKKGIAIGSEKVIIQR